MTDGFQDMGHELNLESPEKENVNFIAMIYSCH